MCQVPDRIVRSYAGQNAGRLGRWNARKICQTDLPEGMTKDKRDIIVRKANVRIHASHRKLENMSRRGSPEVK